MIKLRYFDKTVNGQNVYAVSIYNSSGAYVDILNYGATVRALAVPDKYGSLRDIVLGYDSTAEYQSHDAYFGAVIGRCANRITGPAFTLNGKTYKLVDNTGAGTALHGGAKGFDKKLWKIDNSVFDNILGAKKTKEELAAGHEVYDSGNSISFSLISPDGDENYPGKLSITVTYAFSDNFDLDISYTAKCSEDTLLNVTNHSYFNLDGHDCGHNCLKTYVKINSDEITPLGDKLTPTGEFMKIAGTAYDFNNFKTIGSDLNSGHPQLVIGGGYDQNFVLRDAKGAGKGMTLAAEAYSKDSGIFMKTYTDLPGVQFYIGNFITDMVGKNGAVYGKRSGFCFETQNFPNSVNIPQFPSAILKKGERYNTETRYSFGVIK